MQHKAPAEYSNNQLQKWYNKKNGATANTIGLICKAHAPGEREIRCHGHCDLVKAVSHFSKNQRNIAEPASRNL